MHCTWRVRGALYMESEGCTVRGEWGVHCTWRVRGVLYVESGGCTVRGE